MNLVWNGRITSECTTVFTRRTIRVCAISVTLLTLAICLLMPSSRAHAARRTVVTEPDTLDTIADAMFEEQEPGRQIKRLSQSSLQEYDLNNDGRLSELESARASAMIRESRNELDRYGSLLTILQFWSE